jgi:predicted GNAT family acetyltransferase
MLLRRMVSSITSDSISIVHDLSRNVFRAMSSDGIEIGHLEYRLIDNEVVDFCHTFTRPEAQGKGVAGRMVKAGLDWAQQRRMRVIGSCSYVESFLRKNPIHSSSP